MGALLDVSTDNSVASFYELLLPLLIDHGNPSATSFTQVLDISQESRQLRNVAGDAPRPVHVSTLAMSAWALVPWPCCWPKMLIPFFHASVVCRGALRDRRGRPGVR